MIAIALGEQFGAKRTGAIGGVAAKYLSGGKIHILGLIGTGTQAWTQLWAISGFTRPDRVNVYSRRTDALAHFVRRARDAFAFDVQAAADPRGAVDGADYVITATTSATPVLDPAWLEPNAAVTTMGPKQVNAAEFTMQLATEAALLVTDSPVQLNNYDPPSLLAGMDAVVDLSDVVAGKVTVPSTGRRVFCSVGLAGTEIHLLGRLSEQLGQRPEP